MKFVTLGAVSSQREFEAACNGARGDQVLLMMEFLTLVAATEKRGLASVGKRWRGVPADAAMQLYVGAPSGGMAGIWAAVAVAADGRSVTLLKLVDTYRGGELEAEGLLGDARDRKRKGRVFP